MKVGDIVSYSTMPSREREAIGIVLHLNKRGGTIQVLCNGKRRWFATSGCEVISESRRPSKV